MDRRRKTKRIVPEQDSKICGTICLCQMTMILSCVSFVYLTVAIYVPAHRAFNIGMEQTPVMCQTVISVNAKNCTWASCGEWCLTKTTGFCPQFYVNVRQNGTTIELENCSRLVTVSCPPANEDAVTKYNCNKFPECQNLTGVFRCRLGHCSNISEIYLCKYTITKGPVINSVEDNLKLNGNFYCENARCQMIKELDCDRYCSKITTAGLNVFLRYDNNVYTGLCEFAVAYNAANGSEPGYPIVPSQIWSDERDGGILLGSCASIQRIGLNSIRGIDCINGTILPDIDLPQPFMNFSQLWSIYRNSKTLLDPLQKFMPHEETIMIYNYSKLYINLEGCVNTLRGECKQFLVTHGQNGSDNTASCRFHCYYNKNATFVVARFDLNETWLELMIAVCVPGGLFIFSFVTLMIITQTVRVGDDAKMRCKWCTDNNNANDNEIELELQQINGHQANSNNIKQENSQPLLTSKSL